MSSYLVLNLLFMTATVIALRIRRLPSGLWRTLGILVILTAIFDSIIVGLHIVAYDQATIVGIYIGNAPLEDFCYSLLAALMMPRLWQLAGRKRGNHER